MFAVVILVFILHAQHKIGCMTLLGECQFKYSCRLACMPKELMQCCVQLMLTSLVRTAAPIPTPITIKKPRVHKPKDTCNFIQQLQTEVINNIFKHWITICCGLYENLCLHLLHDSQKRRPAIPTMLPMSMSTPAVMSSTDINIIELLAGMVME